MSVPVALSLILAMVPMASAPAPADGVAGADGGWFVPADHRFQDVIEQRITIRVPARPGALTSFTASEQVTVSRPAAAQVSWKEVGGPRCVAVRGLWSVVGARKDSIDILTREREMLRAKLSRGCRSLDFYSGFYMRGTRDALLCADRDTIQARSGVECEIDGFRRLVAETKRRKK